MRALQRSERRPDCRPIHQKRVVVKRGVQTHAEPPDFDGVRALLDRDRRIVDLPDSDPFADEGPSQPTPEPEAPAAGRQAAKTRAQVVEKEEVEPKEQHTEESQGPRTASQAIEQGIATLAKEDAEGAIELFQRALELPGKGAFRMQGSAKEYSCASDGEEVAALYNLACAYAACGRDEAALASLEGAIEAGFSDWDFLRADGDLGAVQGPALEALIRQASGGNGSGFLARLNPFRRRK